MKLLHSSAARLRHAVCAASLLLMCGASHGRAATLTQRLEPNDVNVGDEITVTITINNGGNADIQLPHVDGLQVTGTSTSTQLMFNNGAFTSALSQVFTVVAERPGDFTIPAFDLNVQGQTLHVQAMKLHVSNNGTAPASGVAASPTPAAGPDRPRRRAARGLHPAAHPATRTSTAASMRRSTATGSRRGSSC